MALPLINGLRVAESNLCRKCAILPARRAFASIAQTPKHEIRSRSTTSPTNSWRAVRCRPSRISSSPDGQAFSSSSRQLYKTIQEAESRYKLGVSLSPSSHNPVILGLTLNSHFRGKPASSLSLRASASPSIFDTRRPEWLASASPKRTKELADLSLAVHSTSWTTTEKNLRSKT